MADAKKQAMFLAQSLNVANTPISRRVAPHSLQQVGRH